MRTYNKLFFGLLFLFAVSASCTSKKPDGESAISPADSSLVVITQRQFDALGMEFGDLREAQFSETVKVNGHIVSSV